MCTSHLQFVDNGSDSAENLRLSCLRHIAIVVTEDGIQQRREKVLPYLQVHYNIHVCIIVINLSAVFSPRAYRVYSNRKQAKEMITVLTSHNFKIHYEKSQNANFLR